MRETSARLLRLLSLLQTRRDWSGVELAERLDITPRTVRRDVDKLRGLGYPVDATVGVGGGVPARRGCGDAALLLDDDEVLAVALGLQSGATARSWHRRVVGTRTHQVAAGDAVTAATPTRGTAGGRRAARTRAERGGRRGAVRDRIGVPRPRASPLRLPDARRRREPPRGGAVSPCPLRISMVFGGVGPVEGGLAVVPRRPHGSEDSHRTALHPSRTPARRGRGVRRARHRPSGDACARPSAAARSIGDIAPMVDAAWGTLEDAPDGRCVIALAGESPSSIARWLSAFDVDFTVLDPPNYVTSADAARRTTRWSPSVTAAPDRARPSNRRRHRYGSSRPRSGDPDGPRPSRRSNRSR